MDNNRKAGDYDYPPQRGGISNNRGRGSDEVKFYRKSNGSIYTALPIMAKHTGDALNLNTPINEGRHLFTIWKEPRKRFSNMNH